VKKSANKPAKKSAKKALVSLVLLALVIAATLVLTEMGVLPALTEEPTETVTENVTATAAPQNETVQLSDIPEYTGDAYIALNDNIPLFTEADMTTEAYEFFSELDELGRCGMTISCVGKELMPEEDRGEIGSVKPSGWVSVTYDFVDGRYLYNRCHLIGFQLTGENANRKNLITGTRYLNIEGMLPFENMVADYVKETSNHVLYRVTPIFEGDELVARGVQLEGWSVEDNGEGICFNVYAYNVQPGVIIDYATGKSREAEEKTFVLNTDTKKMHLPECGNVVGKNSKNLETRTCSRQTLIDEGYEPCGQCNP